MKYMARILADVSPLLPFIQLCLTKSNKSNYSYQICPPPNYTLGFVHSSNCRANKQLPLYTVDNPYEPKNSQNKHNVQYLLAVVYSD